MPPETAWFAFWKGLSDDATALTTQTIDPWRQAGGGRVLRGRLTGKGGKRETP